MLSEKLPMSSTTPNTVTQYQAELAHLTLPGQSLDWLATLRKHSMQQFQQWQFPTRKQEDWKYTQPTGLAHQHFAIKQTDAHTLTAEKIQKIRLFTQCECHLVVLVNGIFAPTLSQIDDLPNEVVLQDLAAAIQQKQAVLQTALTAAPHANSQHSFTALNTALMHAGFCLIVPKHCQLTKPVYLLHIAEAGSHAAHVRNVIVLHENSSAQVIEHYHGETDQAYFHNVITDIQLQTHARLQHYKIINESNLAFHIATTRATQQHASHFDSFSLTVNGGLVRSDTQALLQAPQSHAKLNGLFITQDNQHVDHHTYIEHAAEYTTSDEHYRGILTDHSRGVFNGRVMVNPGAMGTQACQQNKNLLLSHYAEIDTKPQLEIFADDVKCTHGATVGQLDEAALFYCQARGISLNEAKFMLTSAFANNVLETVDNDDLRDGLTKFVSTYLPQ